MGDMADMLIDQMFDDPFGDEEDGDDPAGWAIRCRCCGRQGLHWEIRNGKWRLHDARGIHVCSVNPLKEPLVKEPKAKMPSVPEGEWLPVPAGYKMSEERRKGL